MLRGCVRNQRGAANHMVRHPDSVVRRARLLSARGYTPSEICEHLADEGQQVNADTVWSWVHGKSRIAA
ncbi:MAG: hypothetical protein ACPHN2_08875 [Sinimarinibacterium flocculans]|uniref:hypothetical protein n=1 Tax=Sinimarinibacterium flocculans TaxID=985250 RepID=UPI003C3F2754